MRWIFTRIRKKRFVGKLKRTLLCRMRSIMPPKHKRNWLSRECTSCIRTLIKSLDKGFTEWIEKSPIRQQLFNQANNFDVDAANELLSTYKELRAVRQT